MSVSRFSLPAGSPQIGQLDPIRKVPFRADDRVVECEHGHVMLERTFDTWGGSRCPVCRQTAPAPKGGAKGAAAHGAVTRGCPPATANSTYLTLGIVAALALMAIITITWLISQTAPQTPVTHTILVTQTGGGGKIVVTATLPPPPAATSTHALPHNNDGSHIVYTCFIEEIDQVCRMDGRGGDQRQLTFASATNFYASLTPSGQDILFSSRRGTFEIAEMTSDGSRQRQIGVCPGEEGCYAPDLSPAGNRIVFTVETAHAQNIWVMHDDGSGAVALTSDENVDNLDPVWSPDGSQILFASDRTGVNDLYIVDADGSNLHQVTFGAGVGGRSDWSPDGRTLAFYAGQSGHTFISLVDVDGSNMRRLTGGNGEKGPSFSPDGQWLAYASDEDGDNEIYIIRINGTGWQQLTHNSIADYQPRWGN